MAILKKAISEDGNTMIMYTVNNLYAVMFNGLPCVNPSDKKHTEKMWQRHVNLYRMHEVQVKPDEQLPEQRSAATAVLDVGRGVHFLKPKKKDL